MKSIKRPIRNEMRQRARASFNENMAETALGKDRQNVAGVDAAIGMGQRNLFDAVWQGDANASFADDEATDAILAQHQGRGRQAAIWIDHEACRVASWATADIETRLVSEHRTDPDQHGIDMGAQLMEVIERRILVDPAAFTGGGGDPAIKRLT